MSVLIVEPSKAVVHILDTLFGKFGFETRVARNGKEALEMLRKAPAELLCFTYELGDMDGIEFFVTAKANKLVHHQPGLLFCSTQNREEINRALVAGVTECFSKFNLDQLEYFVEHFAANNHKQISGRVLLVEDSTSAITYYVQILTRMGLQVEVCKSAENAIETLNEKLFDLVVTDYILAGEMTGFAVIRAIREAEGEKASTPILVISTFDDMARKIEILRNGANDFVAKPVVTEELEVRVSNMLMLQKLMRRLETQHEAMKDIAIHDQLTRVYNRYYLNGIIGDLIDDARGKGKSLSLIVADLDHFKHINDTHGHKAGDQVLQQVAQKLQCICRNSDVVARIGGEEFIVVLPGVALEEATIRGETARELIASPSQNDNISITASLGVASLAASEGYDELFSRADSAMYRAKAAGRNRVEIAQP